MKGAFGIRLKQVYMNLMLIVFPLLSAVFVYYASDVFHAQQKNYVSMLLVYGSYYFMLFVFIVFFFLQRPQINRFFIIVGILECVSLMLPLALEAYDPLIAERVWRVPEFYLFVMGLCVSVYLFLYLVAQSRRRFLVV